MSGAPILSVTALTKHFALTPANRLTGRAAVTLHAVDGVTLDLHAGQAVGLVGNRAVANPPLRGCWPG